MKIDVNSFSKRNNGQDLKNIVFDRPISDNSDIPEEHKAPILQHLDFIAHIQNLRDLDSYVASHNLDFKKTGNTYSISIDSYNVNSARLLFSVERNWYLHDIEYRKLK